ncbi:protein STRICTOSIDINE SYNTHASE-LIKE 4-like [Vicia villosa]|uniref:protein STRICTOSIDINE SYNTHASE-LIKE 4-like n=1 Tax=Vicia villosa TaxID=3911 RepID=UPI00273C5983|nr:protein STRICTOSIDINE SYNTHASE-LIKE 4-like [Vicia villosa]
MAVLANFGMFGACLDLDKRFTGRNTYDVVRSGVPNICAVALALSDLGLTIQHFPLYAGYGHSWSKFVGCMIYLRPVISISLTDAGHDSKAKGFDDSSYEFGEFLFLYRLEPFEPVHFPFRDRELPRRTLSAPAVNPRMRFGSEVVVEGKVDGPEDLAYDKRNRLIYTGCDDGWIKRITVNKSVADSVVKNWVNTGGRPLGLALEKTGELIVADAVLGLLRVTVKGKESKVEVLANEYDGLKFNLTDGVDVGEDGTIYFTDATYKYNLKDFYFDIAERKPHGRFMSYNPTTKKVTLLARNLYFANGVAVAPDQKFVVYCETILKNLDANTWK